MRIGLKIREGWSTLGLLTLMLLTVAWSINSAEWTESLAILQWVVLASLAIGFILAKSRLPGFVAHLLSLISGMAWVTFLVGTLLPSTLSWTEKLLNLADRFTTWLLMAFGEESSFDTLIFVLTLAALFWLLGYLCAWFTFRSHRVWGVIIPSGITMLANLYYGPPHLVIYLIVYLFCALLLIVRSNVFAQEEEWQEARVGYQADIGFDFLRYGAILSVIIVLCAWIVPTAAASPQFSVILDHFEGPWQEIQDHWRRLFASLNYQGQISINSFGKTMTLSGPVSLGNTPIMDVQAEKGYYWRAVVYDKYTGSGWVNTDDETLSLNANSSSPPLPQFDLRLEMPQTIRPLQPGTNLLFAAPQPVRVGLPAKIELSYVPSSVTTGQGLSSPVANISIIHSRSRLKKGQVYTVVSSVTWADVESLRSAGMGYPARVTARYLQLPPTLPDRVRALAEDITKDYDNPFDKATALEGYLRKIPYNELINAPPPGQDGVDYFLFDSRQGYCDYYASALAVMARAVGIPSRLASGYARGEHSASKVYRVKESDAHTWVEIYFPRYGWVEFEPTASQPLIARPEPESSEDLAMGDSEASGGRREGEEKDLDAEIAPGTVGIPIVGIGSWSMVLFWGGALVLFVIGSVMVSWYLWTREPKSSSPVERIYEKMARYAQLIGIGWPAHQTPYEYAAALIEALPQGRARIVQITDCYVKERFSSGGTDEGEIKEAKEAWRDLRSTLWQQAIRETPTRLYSRFLIRSS